MKNIYLLKLLHSNYCKIVFVLSFWGAYYLLPGEVYHSVNGFVAMFYLLLFAFLMTCVVRNVKERAILAHRNKASILGIAAASLGFVAFHVCGIAAPVCGASAALGIAALAFPAFVHNFLLDNGYLVIYTSIVIQIAVLLYMGCFRIKHN
jgi:hypothetical protein